MATGGGRHIGERATPRTIIALTLLFLGTLWFLVIVSALSARQDSIDATSDLLRRMNHAVEEQTKRQFDLIAVFFAACEQILSADPARDPRGDAAFRGLSERFRARTAEAIAIRLVTPDGETLEIIDQGTRPLANVAANDFFAGALAHPGLFVGRPTPGLLPGGRHGLPVALRLQQPAHGVALWLAVIDLQTLSAAYEKQRRKPGGTIALLRDDGTVLASAPQVEPLPGRSTIGAPPFGEHLAALRQGVVLLEDVPGRSGNEFASYSSMPDLPLVIMVSEDQGTALAPWFRQTLWIALLAFAATLPLVVVAYRSLLLLRTLASHKAQLQHLSTTDHLTGASSRQHFVKALAEALLSSRREETALTVVLFDIDFFQRINDGYGHAVGDQVLIRFAAAARNCLRDIDLLGRVGAGEFATLLPNTSVTAAVLVAERVRREVAGISIPTENGTVQFTASAGATMAVATDKSVDDLLKRAAEALHEATAGGHDRVMVA